MKKINISFKTIAVAYLALSVSFVHAANKRVANHNRGINSTPSKLSYNKLGCMPPQAFGSIQEALSQPLGTHFWLAKKNGAYTTGHSLSYFRNVTDYKKFSFDISNNKALINMRIDGSLDKFAVFTPTHYGDRGMPGGWHFCDPIKSDNIALTISIAGSEVTYRHWPFKAGYLGGIFPYTEYSGETITAKILAYAPISSDGKLRPRVGVYGMLLQNVSKDKISGHVSCKGEGMLLRRVVSETQGDSNIASFSLAPGEQLWVPFVLSPLGAADSDGYATVNAKGTLHWLNETWRFFSRMTGCLEMPDDPLTAEMIHRCMMSNFNSIAMDADGNIAAVMFGSRYAGEDIPIFNGGVNNLDAYFAFEPLTLCAPSLASKGVLWFSKYGVPVKGVSHSLTNALSANMLAGLYYERTGDKQFFKDHSDLKTRLIEILDIVYKTRKDDELWMFPSKYYSDGVCHADYHTGSNVSAWFSYKTLSRILGEAYGDQDAAERHLAVSARIKEAINRHCVVDGPFGRQLNEGVNKADKDPFPIMHDGEEISTTLAPVYGYLDYDDSRYNNHKRFAMTKHNTTKYRPDLCYDPETKGLGWYGCTVATFSGYMTGLAACKDKETMHGPEGHLTEIKRLTDLNGTMWWWPYPQKGAKRGQVRREIAPCGFAYSVFTSLAVSEYIGVKYDAPGKKLSFRPFLLSNDFSWQGLRMGTGTFDVKYRVKAGKVQAYVKNSNPYPISLQIELIPVEGYKLYKHSLSGQRITPSKGSFFERETAIFQVEVPAQGEVIARALMKSL